MRRTLALLVSACLLACLLAIAPDASSAQAGSKTVSARTLLAKLTVREEDHSHGYQRARFGYDSGYDADRDGCSTRKEVLIRDAISIDHVSTSCAVYGAWRSLYDRRVTRDPSTLEVDHLVPLAEAWHAGAYAWSHRRQVAFGNDVGYEWSLQAVTSALNQGTGAGKGDQDPAEWLPPRNRCTYAKAWIAVKYRWTLPVDAAEKAALVRELGRCASVTVLRPGEPDLEELVGH